jgi:hypothetical protein
MAPDLTWAGSAVQRMWLFDFLKNPNTLRPALIRRMPKFNLSDVEAGILADYIMTVYQTPAFDPRPGRRVAHRSHRQAGIVAAGWSGMFSTRCFSIRPTSIISCRRLSAAQRCYRRKCFQGSRS